MRIAIATTGRFHVLDLARELSQLGHEVAFYSFVPRRRAVRFGLPVQCHRALFPWLSPLILLQHVTRGRFPRVSRALLVLTDWLTALRLEPCDVFIGMSGLALQSAEKAQRDFGAKIFLERGSRHILSQKEILDDLFDRGLSRDRVPDYIVPRELAGYAMADRIVVPSLHVERSFLERGVSADRLFRNAYGVDLEMFPATPAPVTLQPTLLFVGGWTYRKGVDLLVAAWRKLGDVKLMHVGGLGDAPLPVSERFVHVDPVPQWRLTEIYGQAHLFVLASREEGLALVQPQALASGLPLVCSDRTGGEDLRDIIPEPTWIKVVPHDDVDALANGIRELLPKAMALQGVRNLLGSVRSDLAWEAYGRRYAHELERLVDGR